ncbi:MAG: hypothetical protein AB2L20_25510 [Mangrovibacterium sp.]
MNTIILIPNKIFHKLNFKVMRRNIKTSVASIMAIVPLVLIIIVGCQKEEDEFLQSCDFENPYDYVGKYHNEGLIYVLAKIEDPVRLKSEKSKIESNVFALASDFCKQNSLGNAPFSEDGFASAVQMAKKIRLKSNSSVFSQTQLYYHTKFLDILASPNNCKSISDVLTKIKTIESEIYFSNMENNEKEALLVTYAIGRNSLEFWLGCDKKSLRPRLKSGGESFDFLDWWNEYVTPAICAIVETDFYGAASGALGGAVLGATSGTVILPGVGTITGTIVGAVEGAAYGAVYSSLIGGISYYYTVSN